VHLKSEGSNFIRQTLLDLKEEIGSNTVILVVSTLPLIHRSSRPKKVKEESELNKLKEKIFT
jgi:hypothetical protein